MVSHQPFKMPLHSRLTSSVTCMHDQLPALFCTPQIIGHWLLMSFTSFELALLSLSVLFKFCCFTHHLWSIDSAYFIANPLFLYFDILYFRVLLTIFVDCLTFALPDFDSWIAFWTFWKKRNKLLHSAPASFHDSKWY